MTLSLDVDEGSIVMYGSDEIQTPNEALHDFMLSEDMPEIFLTSDILENNTFSNNITVYTSIEGLSTFNSFTLNTTVGDTTTGM